MACCLCFFRTSKSLISLLIVTFAVFTSFSMSLSVLFIILSILVFFTFSEKKPIISDEISQQEAAASRSSYRSLPQEKQPPVLEEIKNMFISAKVENETEMLMRGPKEEENRKGPSIGSQDLDSECESMDEQSSSDSGREDDRSDIEWQHDMEQNQEEHFLSDEESLIEIAIPSGQFVSLQEEDPQLNLKCKLSAEERFQEFDASDFMADTDELMGEQEDNLIEIDIYMGSIKYSKHYGTKSIPFS